MAASYTCFRASSIRPTGISRLGFAAVETSVLMADLTVRRCYVIVASISTNQLLVQAVPVIGGRYPRLESGGSISFCICNDLHLTDLTATYRPYRIAEVRLHMRNSYQRFGCTCHDTFASLFCYPDSTLGPTTISSPCT